MRKLAGFSGLLLLLVMPAMAQDTAPTPAPTPKDTSRYTPKLELSAGYTYRPYYTESGSKLSMSGWYGSIDYNVKSWVGAEVEMLGVYKSVGSGENIDLYTLMIGPRIYPLRHRTLTPFGHFLYGGGRYSMSIPAIGGFPAETPTDYAHAWEVGGGLDMNIRKHLGVRLEADYGKTSFFSGNNNQGSPRISVGIVYHFGSK